MKKKLKIAKISGIEQVVDELNKIYEADPACMDGLFNVYFACNETIAESAITVRHDNGADYVSLIGILNGMFSTKTKKIAKVFDETTNKFTGFKVLSEKPVKIDDTPADLSGQVSAALESKEEPVKLPEGNPTPSREPLGETGGGRA